MRRVWAQELESLATALLEADGVPSADAALTAACLVAANLRGIDSHGVRLLPVYLQRIRRGLINPAPRLRVLASSPAGLCIDGDNGPGPLVAARSMDLCLERAARAGVALAVVRRSNHFGAAQVYAMRALSAGMIGIATSNGSAAVAPWGGSRAYFGANPLAVAVPAGEEGPIIFDMAPTPVSRARIRMAAGQGEKIPWGWALDEHGQPTDDPLRALQGALLPLAGHKGFGLILVLEVLAGVLSGAGFGLDTRDLYTGLDGPQGIGHCFLAIDPAHFLPAGDFASRMDRLCRDLKAQQGVRLPGQRGHATAQQREREGIPLPDDVASELSALAAERGLGIPASLN